MPEEQTKYDYNLLASRFISDETLSIKVQNNVTFVENYLDKIDVFFEEEVEKQIAFREMGIIVYSCIEALLKSTKDVKISNATIKKHAVIGSSENCLLLITLEQLIRCCFYLIAVCFGFTRAKLTN